MGGNRERTCSYSCLFQSGATVRSGHKELYFTVYLYNYIIYTCPETGKRMVSAGLQLDIGSG